MTQREVYSIEFSEEEMKKVEDIYFKIKSIEGLITKFDLDESNEKVFDKLILDLSRAKRDYERIYTDQVKKNKWDIVDGLQWTIDFEENKLKIIDPE